MNLNKHSKVRTVGLSSSFALLALLGLAVSCPSSYDNAAHAAETSTATFELDFILQKTTSATFAIDFLLAQQLSISMSDLPAATTTSVQPTSSGAQTSAYQDFSVSTNSTSGLGIYVYGDGDNTLVGTDVNNTIPSITANATLANMPANTWGYDLSQGTPAASSLTFKPVPATKGAVAQTTSTTTTDQSYRLTFGANVDLNKAPDTYSRTVNVQVVPNSAQTTALEVAGQQADSGSDNFEKSVL